MINILFVPFVLGINKTMEIDNKSISNHSSSSTESRTHIETVTNKPKVPVPSEGSMPQNTPSLTLLKDKHATLLLLEKDLIKEKSGELSTSKIYARKGVDSTQISHDNTTDGSKETMDMKQHQSKITTHIVSDTNGKTENKGSVEPKKTNKTEVPKKPLILSYSKLAMDQQIPDSEFKIPAVKSSSNTLVSDQIPSPSKDASGPTTKVHPVNGNRPDMITPIVITILVVPMFAVLGYMVLRRGQEAWKNRHYKRMDFLLDGMYND